MRALLIGAGIRVGEAAQLFRVARTTLYRWLETTPPPSLTYDVAQKIMRLIEIAVENGDLPVKDVVGKARIHAIRVAIQKAAKG